MAFSWAGAAEFLKEKREESLMREQWERERKEKLSNMLLPTLMEMRANRIAMAKKHAQVFTKGSQLFGQEVATILDNIGNLEEIVAQYKGTESDRGWAKSVINRVEGFMEKLRSGDDKDKAMAAKLLVRAAPYADADIGSQSDFLAEVLADGYVNLEEFDKFSLGTPSRPVYEGTIPDLGKFDTLTPTQLRSRAAEILSGVVADPDSRLIPDGAGSFYFTSDKINANLAQILQQEIADQLEGAQYEYGPSAATEQVLLDWQDRVGKTTQTMEKFGYTGPVPSFIEGANKPTVDPTKITPEEFQENVGAPEVELPNYAPKIPTPTFEQVLEEEEDRFKEK